MKAESRKQKAERWIAAALGMLIVLAGLSAEAANAKLTPWTTNSSAADARAGLSVPSFAELAAGTNSVKGYADAATNALSGVLTTRITNGTNDLSGALTTRIGNATNDLNTVLVARIQGSTNLVYLSLIGVMTNGQAVTLGQLPSGVLTNGQSTATTLSNALTVVGTNSVMKLLVGGASADGNAAKITGTVNCGKVTSSGGFNASAGNFYEYGNSGAFRVMADGAWHFYDQTGTTHTNLVAQKLIAADMVISTNGVFGAFGCATMGTGTVAVATSASTNIFDAYSYTKTFGGIGVVSNSTFMVTNAGTWLISFGASLLGGSGDTVKLLVYTNDVHCGLVSFVKTMQTPAIAETGFKEFAVTLPANCLVSFKAANSAANATSIQNLCVNVKGAN